MAEWEGKSKGTPLGYKIFIFLIKRIGIRSAYLLLYPVVAYYYLFSRSSNHALDDFFKRLKKYSSQPLRTSHFKTYYNMGQVLIDKTAIISGVHSNIEIFRDGGQNLVNMDKNKTGGFLISAHVGNWEIAGHLTHHLKTRINVVLLDEEHEQIKRVMNKAVGERHFNIIPIRKDMSHMFKIHTAATNKELICIHGDRFLPGSKTFTSPFLGEDAAFPTGPFIMASKLGLPVSFVYGMKETSTCYHFYCTDPVFGEKDPKVIFKSYITMLENIVMKYPNQWYNFYPFWSKK